jgi:hypothetical protein
MSTSIAGMDHLDGGDGAKPSPVTIRQEVSQASAAAMVREYECLVTVNVETPVAYPEPLHEMVHPENAKRGSGETLAV